MKKNKTTQIGVDVRAEAKRLNSLGALLITINNDAKPNERQDRAPIRGRVIGFAVDGEERDCILVRAPYGASGRFVTRCLVASQITRIEILGDGDPRPTQMLDV